MAKLLKPDFEYSKAIGQRKMIFDELTGSVFDKQVKYDMSTYLPDLLTRQDKMSMAHSIENRVPFLDNEVVDHSFSIPAEYFNSLKVVIPFVMFVRLVSFLLSKTYAGIVRYTGSRDAQRIFVAISAGTLFFSVFNVTIKYFDS